ncbi:MAG: hypothetical protein AAF717_01080 [Bacteroidota bacterium]
MKAILTYIFIILIGTSAMAQEEIKVPTQPETVNLTITIKKTTVSEGSVARLYLFKNSRVKKALAFKTKRNRPKMA